LLLYPQFHIRIADARSGPSCNVPIFEAAGGTSVHRIEQIPVSCVGFWDRWKGMM